MNDIWLGFIVGCFVTGVIAMIIVMCVIGKWYIGDLREDRSVGEGEPYHFMEIAKGAARQLQTNRFVLLRVKRENYIHEGDTQS